MAVKVRRVIGSIACFFGFHHWDLKRSIYLPTFAIESAGGERVYSPQRALAICSRCSMKMSCFQIGKRAWGYLYSGSEKDWIAEHERLHGRS